MSVDPVVECRKRERAFVDTQPQRMQLGSAQYQKDPRTTINQRPGKGLFNGRLKAKCGLFQISRVFSVGLFTCDGMYSMAPRDCRTQILIQNRIELKRGPN